MLCSSGIGYDINEVQMALTGNPWVWTVQNMVESVVFAFPRGFFFADQAHVIDCTRSWGKVTVRLT